MSVSKLQRLPMCTISLTLAKPGEAMPAGPAQQLYGVSPACVPERCRTGGPGDKIGNARWFTNGNHRAVLGARPRAQIR